MIVFRHDSDSKRFSVAPEGLCKDRLLEQLCHSKLARGGAEFLNGLEARVGVQERMLVEQHQSREDFGHDSASRRTHVNRGVVIDELLLRFCQNVIPQRRIVLESAERRKQGVGGRVVFVRLADLQLRVGDGFESQGVGDQLPGRKAHARAT